MAQRPDKLTILERRAKAQEEGTMAMQDYLQKKEDFLAKGARLRALRLAHEADNTEISSAEKPIPSEKKRLRKS